MESLALRFAGTARNLTEAARSAGYSVPAFRTPPRVAGRTRTIRRHRGGAVVSVVVRGRPWSAVVADMVDGIVVVNTLDVADVEVLRDLLWGAADEQDTTPLDDAPARPVLRAVPSPVADAA